MSRVVRSFVAPPVDVIRPIRSSYLSNDVLIINLHKINNNCKQKQWKYSIQIQIAMGKILSEKLDDFEAENELDMAAPLGGVALGTGS